MDSGTRFQKHKSHLRKKSAFCIRKNKIADQLRGNRAADQRLCLRYIDSTISLLSNFEAKASFVVIQTSLCQTWSQTVKTSFVGTCLIKEKGRVKLPGLPFPPALHAI